MDIILKTDRDKRVFKKTEDGQIKINAEVDRIDEIKEIEILSDYDDLKDYLNNLIDHYREEGLTFRQFSIDFVQNINNDKLFGMDVLHLHGERYTDKSLEYYQDSGYILKDEA